MIFVYFTVTALAASIFIGLSLYSRMSKQMSDTMQEENQILIDQLNRSVDVWLRRIMKLYELNEKQAADKIKKTDRERQLYYEARTGREWGGIESNSMMFNTSLLGIDGAVDALEAIYRKWDAGRDVES